MKAHIVSAKKVDLQVIRRVHERAFGRPDESRLVARLHIAEKAVVSLVAMCDNIVAGSVVFSPVTIGRTPSGFRALGLAPVAVIPEFQKNGIGSRLIREGLGQCSRNGYDAVVVLGSPDYYTRFGFLRGSDHGLVNEYGVIDEFMIAELRARALEGVTGLVQYAPEFQDVR